MQIDRRPGLPFLRTALCSGFSDGYAEGCEAVHDGHTVLELGDLTIKVPRGQSLAEQFDTMQPIVGKTIPGIVF